MKLTAATRVHDMEIAGTRARAGVISIGSGDQLAEMVKNILKWRLICSQRCKKLQSPNP